MKFKTVLVVLALAFFLPAIGDSQEGQIDSGLTVHEWGTFTSIAGSRGEAVEWVPKAGQDDLPRFVEHLRTSQFKIGLLGTVRMETPVLYFYATHQATVSVHVRFAKGLITEWYPHAKGTDLGPRLFDVSLSKEPMDGGITWDSILVDPNGSSNFPKEGTESHYYAARETSASPLSVNSAGGPESEKFLFYRGISAFRVPISVVPMKEDRLLVSNLAGETVPQAILYERRGEKLGYRLLGPVRNSSIVDPPELNSDIETLGRDLEKILAEQGLYADEAHAMVQTWKDSWFEEGSRLLYVVPRTFVNKVLPLTIKPAPRSTTRAFVGRMEIVTPTTEKAIETAFASNDRVTLAKYGRFLAPILQTMADRSSDPARLEQLHEYQDFVFGQLYAQQRGAQQ